MNTPWGEAQYKDELAEGVVAAGTASHGGIGVSGAIAGHLSAAAKKEAIWDGRSWWFEEDCAWAIVAWEFPHLFPDDDQEKVVASLERWNATYLEARKAAAV